MLILSLLASLMGNAWLTVRWIRSEVYAEDLKFGLANMDEVSSIAVAVLGHCRLEKEIVRNSVSNHYRSRNSEIAADMLLESPIKFEFDQNEILNGASIRVNQEPRL